MTEDEATKILIEELGWPSFMVELAIRAQFQCEYCGRQLLENVYAYDSWQKDHIVPNGDDALSNLAIACKTCNFIKRHTDPTKITEKTDRASLLQAARSIIMWNAGRRKKEYSFGHEKPPSR
ncbi:HNH endonuclease [bacterium]|nr:HNH endonuclease [bacterium]